ncbi:hypothetical protein RHMOL_Rhmol10G0061100 [Rhododendron molle]|uniref:Uncharacterized protein n=1 Tax=Rhododendron molle TaxID=49168 RepID=A0ACC0M0K7_RHOML|nr:hypothetical protein RHMOL_Rhmol10G0061100 [Rhododendron molle]
MVVLQSSILEMPNTQAVRNNERPHGGRSHHQIPCLRSPKPSQIIGALAAGIITGSDMITCVGILLFHSIISDEVLLKILDLPILVVLDEAYIEFSGIESRMQWVKKHENLIVLRTFSKRAGLAGLRVGYGAFPLSIIEYLWRAKQPYNVSVAAEISACAALKNPDYLEKVKMALVEERERLFQLLKEVPFLNPYPSHSNFILSEVISGMDAKKLKEVTWCWSYDDSDPHHWKPSSASYTSPAAVKVIIKSADMKEDLQREAIDIDISEDLATMGVMIRHFNTKELKSCIRVSVGKPEHTDILMECLNRFR